jgi:hypothetical protein
MAGRVMTHREAHVKTQDLEEALDYLEGLIIILESFHKEDRGRNAVDALLTDLQNMDSQGMNWEPLRYQAGAGKGWQFVAENVAGLRRRLLEGYTDAAL